MRLTAADGTVLREMQIDSSLLSYSVPTRRLVVPRPGRMLVRDHRPPDAKGAADAANAESEEDGLGTQRGATAFQWAESLDYNGVEQRATMKGDVLVAYKPDAQGELPVQLRADEVIALLEDAPLPAGPAPGEPVKAAGDIKAPPVRLRSVRAEGNVVVVRGGEELTAPRLTYDPQSHWIRAVGTDDVPAVFSAGRGNTTNAREFQWNTQTWKMRVVGAAGRAAGSGR
jgi:hypothetical protein